jgi:dipeptidyl aminopeptidase/acylaminoacyl peptidase
MAVSPNGRQIAFTRIDPGRFEQIFVMNVDGSGTRRVSRGDFYDFLPRWSPDGKRIAFTSSRDGTNGVYTMRTDGSDVRNVSRTPLTMMMRPGATVLDVNETLWAWAAYRTAHSSDPASAFAAARRPTPWPASMSKP